MENCPCNSLFRKLFNTQATVIMCIAVLNFIAADCRLHPRWDKRRNFKTNIWMRNIFTELITLQPEAQLGGRPPLPSEWEVYLNRSFAPKRPHKGLKLHKMPCLILDALLTTMQQSGLWTFNWNKNDLNHTITSKVMLVLFTHVFSRDHYVFIICGYSLDSVIRESSELYQSKVYLSSGLFESHKLITFRHWRWKIAFKITMTEICKANPF